MENIIYGSMNKVISVFADKTFMHISSEDIQSILTLDDVNFTYEKGNSLDLVRVTKVVGLPDTFIVAQCQYFAENDRIITKQFVITNLLNPNIISGDFNVATRVGNFYAVANSSEKELAELLGMEAEIYRVDTKIVSVLGAWLVSLYNIDDV